MNIVLTGKLKEKQDKINELSLSTELEALWGPEFEKDKKQLVVGRCQICKENKVVYTYYRNKHVRCVRCSIEHTIRNIKEDTEISNGMVNYLFRSKIIDKEKNLLIDLDTVTLIANENDVKITYAKTA